jgi:hypothetical protein
MFFRYKNLSDLTGVENLLAIYRGRSVIFQDGKMQKDKRVTSVGVGDVQMFLAIPGGGEALPSQFVVESFWNTVENILISNFFSM